MLGTVVVAECQNYSTYFCSVGEALELLIDCVDRVGRHSTLHDWTQVEDRVVNCVVGFVNGSRTNERDALLVSAMKIINAMLRGW